MTKVTHKVIQSEGRSTIICDFSPPRGALPDLLQPAGALDADFVSVAYNPGKSSRINSTIAAHWIKANTGKDVVFTLATRDMNKLAVQSLLLGAQLLGIENVVVVQGDGFTQRELSLVKDVSDFRPTELIRSIARMNESVDYKELKLRQPTDFCIGATLDMSRDLETEISLAHRKVEAGAEFFLSQPTFDIARSLGFLDAYKARYGVEMASYVFHGVQVLAKDGVIFSSVPKWATSDLEKGRSGKDIALQVLYEYAQAGVNAIYLIPPILRGGRRDYDAAQDVLSAFRGAA